MHGKDRGERASQRCGRSAIAEMKHPSRVNLKRGLSQLLPTIIPQTLVADCGQERPDRRKSPPSPSAVEQPCSFSFIASVMMLSTHEANPTLGHPRCRPFSRSSSVHERCPLGPWRKGSLLRVFCSVRFRSFRGVVAHFAPAPLPSLPLLSFRFSGEPSSPYDNIIIF